MSKLFSWFTELNRWKHFVGGILIGIGANSIYCAAYSGVGIASALELKDVLWKDKWDWIDWGVTIGGVAVGYALRIGFLSIIS